MPSGWHGACWPFVWAKQKFLLYGSYPSEHIWRVNLALALGLIGLIYVLIENVPFRLHIGVFMLSAYPVIAFVLLTGGNSNATAESLFAGLIFGLATISVGRLSGRGYLGSALAEFSQLIAGIGWAIVIYFVISSITAVDFGMKPIGTIDWGVINSTRSGDNWNCCVAPRGSCSCTWSTLKHASCSHRLHGLHRILARSAINHRFVYGLSNAAAVPA